MMQVYFGPIKFFFFFRFISILHSLYRHSDQLFLLINGLLLLLLGFLLQLFDGLVHVGTTSQHLREGIHVLCACCSYVVGAYQTSPVIFILIFTILLRFLNYGRRMRLDYLINFVGSWFDIFVLIIWFLYVLIYCLIQVNFILLKAFHDLINQIRCPYRRLQAYKGTTFRLFNQAST